MTTMHNPNWGNLPTEIIQNIFECLEEIGDNFIEYQLVNKQWFFASLSIVYNSVEIEDDDMVDDFTRLKELENFYSFLRNPIYNLGRYTKQISVAPSRNISHLLGMLITYCPNVEQLQFEPSKVACEYILSTQKAGKDTPIWKNLEKVNSGETSNSYHRCLLVFCKSLKHLTLNKIPKISDKSNEESTGTEKNLHDYVGKFKNLKTLMIGENVVAHIFECEKLLQHCSSHLEELEVEFTSVEEVVPRSTIPLSQAQIKATYNYIIYPSLKRLSIDGYTPQSALLEFMYLKHKFVDLEELFVTRGLGMRWESLPSLVIESILTYIFSISKFEFTANYRVNLETVKQFFEAYSRHYTTKSMSIILGSNRDEGIGIANCSRFDSTKKVFTPRIHIHIYREQLLRLVPDPQCVQEINAILNYAGPNLHMLEYRKGKVYGNDESFNERFTYDADVVDMIIRVCKNLQELKLNGIYLKCCNKTQESNKTIQRIEFGDYNMYEKGFFKSLSTMLPNLTHMQLKMDSELKDDMETNSSLDMPMTKFTELWMELTDIGEMSEEVIVVINSKDDRCVPFNRYYTCVVEDDINDTTTFVRELKIVHGPLPTDDKKIDKENDIQMKDLPMVETRAIFHLTCFSIKMLKFETLCHQYILRL